LDAPLGHHWILWGILGYSETEVVNPRPGQRQARYTHAPSSETLLVIRECEKPESELQRKCFRLSGRLCAAGHVTASVALKGWR
jgi:hypothetical protein